MGYVNTPKGQNPWISEPSQPVVSHRAPFPSYHTSRGNIRRPWSGDMETNAGRRLGQIAYGQSMYVTEWIKPQIDADAEKRAAKQGNGGGGNGSGQAAPKVRPQRPGGPRKGGQVPPSGGSQGGSPRPSYVLRNGKWVATGATDLFDTPTSGTSPVPPLRGGPGSPDKQTAAGVPGSDGTPPWQGGNTDPATALEVSMKRFGKNLANPSRSQARSVQTEGPSLLGALPAPDERVGPSVFPQTRRRPPSGMDPRKRGTWANYE